MDNDSFVHSRVRAWDRNAPERLSNEFTLEDIKGAAATITIAGNDTVSPAIRAGNVPSLGIELTSPSDSSYGHAPRSLPNAKPRRAAQRTSRG